MENLCIYDPDKSRVNYFAKVYKIYSGERMKAKLIVAGAIIAVALLVFSPISNLILPIKNRFIAVEFSKNFSSKTMTQIQVESLYLRYLEGTCLPEAIVPLVRFAQQNQREDLFLEIATTSLQVCDLPKTTKTTLAFEVIPIARRSHNMIAYGVAIDALSQAQPNDIQTLIERAYFNAEIEKYDDASVDFFKLFAITPRETIAAHLYTQYFDTLSALNRHCEAAIIYEELRDRPKLRGKALLEAKIQGAYQAGNCSRQQNGIRNIHSVTINSDGQFIVNIYVNGFSGEFLIDTGANVSLAKTSFADSADIEIINNDNFAIRGIGGGVDAVLGQTNNLRIGTIAFGALDFAVVNDDDLRFPFDGILGMNFIRRLNWEINQSVMTLSEK